MLIGQSLLSAGEAATTYNGPWMPRQSNDATFTVEGVYVPSGLTLQFKVQHKNSEESDNLATDAVSATTVTGTTSAPGGDLKELVRYVYLLSSTSASFAHIRANSPIWQPN